MQSIKTTTETRWHEFSRFYLENDILTFSDMADILEDKEDFCTLTEAINYVTRLGACGWSQHQLRNDFHKLSIQVLRWAVENKGEYFPEIYRGTRSERPESEYLILFATTDKAVASFYGPVKIYKNIKGFRYQSLLKSVKTDDYSHEDEEIIFFPDIK